MSATSINILSDFQDFYDYLSTPSGIIYKRNLSDCMNRGAALRYLKRLGTNTLELKQVTDFSYLDGKLVVYTNPNKHNGQGKVICEYEEAASLYPNFLASKYIESSDTTVKFLQIGKRRFLLTFKKDDIVLDKGKLVNIVESEQCYNRLIGLPIFSIDYISNNSEMIATDFNEVQNLSNLDFYNYINPQEICNEVAIALQVYNKVERK